MIPEIMNEEMREKRKQPDPKEITIADEKAYMSEETFNKIPYSYNTSGGDHPLFTPGVMWKVKFRKRDYLKWIAVEDGGIVVKMGEIEILKEDEEVVVLQKGGVYSRKEGRWVENQKITGAEATGTNIDELKEEGMSKLKYFEEGKTRKGYGHDGIIFPDRVFSICKTKKKNEFIISEECDGFFEEFVTAEKAIAIFQEAIDWIKEKQNEEEKNE